MTSDSPDNTDGYEVGEYTHKGVRVIINRHHGGYWVKVGRHLHPFKFSTKVKAMQWAIEFVESSSPPAK